MSSSPPTLAQCVGAYLLYQRTSGTSTETPPAVSKRLKSLVEAVQQRLSPEVSSVRIPLKLQRIASSKSIALNVYLNLCRHPETYHEVAIFCSASTLLTDCLDLSSNSVHKVLEYSDTEHCILPGCIGLNHCLVRKYRSLKQNKGTTCIIHNNNTGPQIGICHSKECVHCKAVYKYQRIYTPNGCIIYLPSKTGLFQFSTALFVNENAIIESGNMFNEKGLSHEYYTKTYNRRFRKRREMIGDVLRSLSQILGRHRSADANLESDSFCTAYYMHFLLKIIRMYILKDVNVPITLKRSDIASFQTATALEHVFLSKKAVKFKVNQFGRVKYRGSVDFASDIWLGIQLNTECGRHDGSLYGRRYFFAPSKRGVFIRAELVDERETIHCQSQWIAVDIQYKILYRSFCSKIWRIPVQALCMVPTLNGVPHRGHKICYGDGNARSRFLCQNPHDIYSGWNVKRIQFATQLHNTQREYRQCSGSPFNGNKFTWKFDLCRHCVFLFLTETELTVENLNHAVRFWNLTERHRRTTSKRRKGIFSKKLSAYSESQSTLYCGIYQRIVGASLPVRCGC